MLKPHAPAYRAGEVKYGKGQEISLTKSDHSDCWPRSIGGPFFTEPEEEFDEYGYDHYGFDQNGISIFGINREDWLESGRPTQHILYKDGVNDSQVDEQVQRALLKMEKDKRINIDYECGDTYLFAEDVELLEELQTKYDSCEDCYYTFKEFFESFDPSNLTVEDEIIVSADEFNKQAEEIANYFKYHGHRVTFQPSNGKERIINDVQYLSAPEDWGELTLSSDNRTFTAHLKIDSQSVSKPEIEAGEELYQDEAEHQYEEEEQSEDEGPTTEAEEVEHNTSASPLVKQEWFQNIINKKSFVKDPFAKRTPFPLHTLPSIFKEMVKEVTESYQVPEDFAGFMALAVLSSKYQKLVKVLPKSDHQENTTLYMMLVASPGERKSPVEKAMLKGLKKFCEGQEENLADSRRKIEMVIEILQAQRKAIINQLKKEGITPYSEEFEKLFAEDRKLRQQIQEEMDKAMSFLALFDDITPAALVDGMAQSGERGALLSSEGGGLTTALGGRFGNALHLDPILKCHSNDSIKVDRKGAEGSFVLKEPSLTIAVAAQPYSVEEMFKNPELKHRGVTARFLYSIPESRVGHRKTDSKCVSPEVSNKYNEFVADRMQTLHDLQEAGNKEYQLRFSTRSKELYTTFFAYVEGNLRPGGLFYSFREWANKSYGTMPILAGLLHLGQEGDLETLLQTPIQEATVKKAVELTMYFFDHAYLAHKMGVPGMRVAKEYLRLLQSKTDTSHEGIRRLVIDKFTITDDELSNALELLVHYKHLDKSPIAASIPPITQES